MKEKYLEKLTQTLLDIKSKKSMQNFLKIIFTPKELEEIPLRLEIIKMLKNGLPQREIAKSLGVGIATITRGSRELKMNKSYLMKWWTTSRWRD